MADLLDVLTALSDVSTLGGWVYRGWAYLFSAPYRLATHARWRRESWIRVVIDVIGSLVVLLVELALVGVIGYAIFG